MTATLTREKVIKEVTSLRRRFKTVMFPIGETNPDWPLEWIEELEDIKNTLVAGQLLITLNELDYKQGELAVAELRGRLTRLAEFIKSQKQS